VRVRLLYIDIDTLRPDHLGCYGYHRDTSPNIDAVAARGVRFESVYTSDSPCLPSRSALGAGQLGIRNGVISHGGATAEPFSAGASRGFWSRIALRSWARQLRNAGIPTTTISTFAERHAAYHWLAGFSEYINVGTGGMEVADLVTTRAIDWIDRRAREPDWFCHVHIWDPHTPYRAPADFGNPFEGDPMPAWYTEDIRAEHWELPGPHSAQEVAGFSDKGFYESFPRQPMSLPDMAHVKAMFDGYDTGIRYADLHVGRWLNALADVGVLDDTAVMISSDHGETFGELGTYCDHHFADEHTNHIPLVLHWPGVAGAEGGRVASGKHYHLDVAATTLELAGARVPGDWDGVSFADDLIKGTEPVGRDHLVLSHGAWTAQRSVRVGDHLYIRTLHDGFHGLDDEMLFDVVNDPHEQRDLSTIEPSLMAKAADLLDSWRADCLAGPGTGIDPMDVLLEEGGPWHVRGRLLEYADRLRATGRGRWADALLEKHPREAAGELPRGGF
jgi:choline-sulfatase